MQATPGEIKSFRSSAERIADMVVVAWRYGRFRSSVACGEDGFFVAEGFLMLAFKGEYVSNIAFRLIIKHS